MSKLGKQPEELSIDQVQCGRADVSTDWLSPRLATSLSLTVGTLLRDRYRNNRTTATAASTCSTSSSTSCATRISS